MRSWKVLFIAIFVLTLGAVNAFAQSSQRDIEITPFGGTKFGGTIGFNPPATYTPTGSESSDQVDYMTIKSSFDYGVLFDYGIWPGFQAEFMWNRQPTELGAHDLTLGQSVNVGPAKLDMLNWGALWEFRGEESKLKPFMAMGIGFTHYNTDGALTDFSNRLSYNIGGGVKYELNDHVGVRLDVRYAPSRTTQSNAEYETEFGPIEERVNNHANQGIANVGVIFKF